MMRLPNPNVPIAFIDQYLTCRQKIKNPSASYLSAVSTWLLNFGKKCIGQNSDKAIVAICDALKKKFNDMDSFEKCINMIVELGEKASQAQSQKVGMLSKLGLTDIESLLCEMLHAIRNYIVMELQSEEGGYRKEYLAKCVALRNEKAAIQGKLDDNRFLYYDDVSNPSGPASASKRNEILLKLVFLEDKSSISQAIDAHLLDDLKHLDKKPENPVYCLQDKFSQKFYEEKLQPFTLISYQEFVNQAINPDAPLEAAPIPKESESASSKIKFFEQHARAGGDEEEEVKEEKEEPKEVKKHGKKGAH